MRGIVALILMLQRPWLTHRHVVPGLNDIFRVSHLDLYQWGIVIGTSFAIIPVAEIVKAIQRAMGKE